MAAVAISELVAAAVNLGDRGSFPDGLDRRAGMPRRRPTIPRVTPELITGDETRLWEALNEIIVALPGFRERHRDITRKQKRLRRLVSSDAWSAYLDIEAAVNKRHEIEMTFIVRHAFEEGRRSVGRGGR